MKPKCTDLDPPYTVLVHSTYINPFMHSVHFGGREISVLSTADFDVSEISVACSPLGWMLSTQWCYLVASEAITWVIVDLRIGICRQDGIWEERFHTCVHN